MIIRKISLKNFGSYTSAVQSFDTGIIGVFGEQRDVSARSNGTGKSTLLESILFSLFGRSRRGQLSDLYFSGAVDKEKLVTAVDFEILGKEYSVSRTWSPSSSSFLLLNEEGVQHSGSLREVQNKVDEIVGVTYGVLSATSFFLQRESDLFTAATASQRLEYLREILGLRFWSKCYTVAVQKGKDLEKNAISLRAQLQLQQQQLDSTTVALESYPSAEEMQSSRDTYSSQLQQLQQALRKAEQEFFSVRTSLEALSRLTQEVTELQQRIEEVEQRLAEMEQISTVSFSSFPIPFYRIVSMEDFQRQETAIDVRLGRLQASIQSEEEFQSRQFDAACPVCRQPVRAETLSRLKQSSSEKLQQLRKNRDQALKDKRETRRKVQEISSRLVVNQEHLHLLQQYLITLQKQKEKRYFEEQLSSLESVLEEKLEEMHSREEQASQVDSIQQRIDSFEQKIRFVQREYDAILTSLTERQQLSQQMTRLEQGVKQLHIQLNQIAGSQESYRKLKTVFGKTGVSFFVIKDVIVSQLTLLVNQILQQLSSGQMALDFSLTSSTDKDTLEIYILQGGVSRKYETFSGGEKTLIDFSLRMGLSNLLRQRRIGSPIQFVVLDEIFGELDEVNKNALENVLLLLRKEFQQIFVISHVPLSITCDQVVTVKKQDGISVI